MSTREQYREDIVRISQNPESGITTDDILCEAAHYLHPAEYYYLLYELDYLPFEEAMFLWTRDILDQYEQGQMEDAQYASEIAAINTYVNENLTEEQTTQWAEKVVLYKLPAANVRPI